MSDLRDSIQRHGEAAAKVTTDGQKVEGELSLQAQGEACAGGDGSSCVSLAGKLWARVSGQKKAKPDLAAGVEVKAEW